MFIENLKINSHISERLGLKKIELRKLDRVVLLAGPNGSGKTRLLTALHWLLTQVERVGYDRLVMQFKSAIEEEKILADDDLQPYTFAGVKANVRAVRGQLEPLSGLGIVFEADEDKNEVLRLYVDIARFISKESVSGRPDLDAKLYVGVPRVHDRHGRNWLASSPLAYIEDASKRHAKLSETDDWMMGSIAPDPEIEDSFVDLASLMRELAALVLSVCPKTGTPTIDGRNLDEVALSPGQESLLRWVVLIHSGILDNVRVPLLLDEPETHLHPLALNRLVDKLLQRFPKSQLWIATHNLSLIAHLAVEFPRSIWYSDNGAFSSTATIIPQVVNGLAGGDGGPDELADFCGCVSGFAINSFAADCLVEPATVKYAKDDPQVKQIFEHIQRISRTPVRILDFGAGQGRLIDGLADRCAQEGKAIEKTIEYYAFEPMQPVREICQRQVKRYFDDNTRRVFGSIEEARQSIDGNVDLVVLTNVLHEIPVTQWISDVFSSAALYELLADDGFMLIVEDTVLPRGELAHSCGFVILEENALRALVNPVHATQEGFVSSIVPKYGQRLQATLIAKGLLPNITHASVACALRTQQQLALDKVRLLRNGDHKSSYSNGRLHSFYAQLVTNTMMAIEEMSASNARP